MLKQITPLVALPVFKDEETTRVAGLLNVILFSALVV
jgi:hypothetical protein